MKWDLQAIGRNLLTEVQSALNQTALRILCQYGYWREGAQILRADLGGMLKGRKFD